ncbi:MAG: hypothetical protein ACXITV_04785, partial [Luteibaculaceae bacterium]
VFLSVDPLAFKMPSWTPYHYTFNNPISFVDPNGMEPQVYVDGIKMGGAMGRFYGNMALEGLNNAVDQSRDITYEHYTTMSMGEYSETHFLGLSTNKNASFGALIDNPFYRGANSGGGNLETARNIGTGAGYLSGGLGLAQMGMMEYQQSLSIHQRINSSARFYPTYRGLGVASKILGRAGNVGAGAGFYLDTRSFATGELGLGRYAYRTSGLGLSIGVGAAVGGPPGAAAGTAVGGIWSGAEYIYDNMLVPLYNEVKFQIWNFERAIRNGWYPGR